MAVTVLARESDGIYNAKTSLFWTYKTIARGGGTARRLLAEVFINIIMMMPIGLISPFVLRGYEFSITLIMGLMISLLIEISQYILQRGFFELDDIFHNIVGTLIGYLTYRVVKVFLIRCKN